MKKHNHFKVVGITILVLFLLTWILPVAVFSGSYAEQGRVQMGLFDLFSYPVASVAYFGYLAVFVLAIGGFYGVLGKTGVYRKLLDKLVDKFKGHEAIFLSVIMVLFAVITSICGLSVGIMIFFPLVISLILLMGYNKLVAAMTTVGAVSVGLIGTTFAAKSVDIMNQILGVTVTTEIWAKVIILVIGLILLIFNTLFYAKKVKGAVADEKDAYIPEKVKTTKKMWPMIVVIDVLLVVMILAFTSWNAAFNLKIFDTATTAVTEFELFGFPIFGKILGSISAFGNWSITEIITVLLMATGLIGLIYRVKFNDFCEAFVKGVKKAAKPAFIVLLVYSCLFIVTYHPFQLVISKWILSLTQGFNIVTTSLVAILASFFNVDMTYTAQSTLPYLVSIVTDTKLYPLIAIIFQSLYGVVMLVAPTSFILMGTLSYLNVSYKDWWKHIWKLLLQLVVVLFIIFTVIMLI